MQDTSNLRSATKVNKGITVILVAVFAIAMGNFASLAASDFIGTWNVKDTAGQSFEITLSGDGTAKASLVEGMAGTWKEEGETAVITWNRAGPRRSRERMITTRKLHSAKVSPWTVRQSTARMRKR